MINIFPRGCCGKRPSLAEERALPRQVTIANLPQVNYEILSQETRQKSAIDSGLVGRKVFRVVYHPVYLVYEDDRLRVGPTQSRISLSKL